MKSQNINHTTYACKRCLIIVRFHTVFRLLRHTIQYKLRLQIIPIQYVPAMLYNGYHHQGVGKSALNIFSIPKPTHTISRFTCLRNNHQRHFKGPDYNPRYRPSKDINLLNFSALCSHNSAILNVLYLSLGKRDYVTRKYILPNTCIRVSIIDTNMGEM